MVQQQQAAADAAAAAAAAAAASAPPADEIIHNNNRGLWRRLDDQSKATLRALSAPRIRRTLAQGRTRKLYLLITKLGFKYCPTEVTSGRSLLALCEAVLSVLTSFEAREAGQSLTHLRHALDGLPGPDLTADGYAIVGRALDSCVETSVKRLASTVKTMMPFCCRAGDINLIDLTRMGTQDFACEAQETVRCSPPRLPANMFFLSRLHTGCHCVRVLFARPMRVP